LRSWIAARNPLFWLPLAFLAATLTLWQWSTERETERIRLFTNEEASRISAAIGRRIQGQVDDSERTGRRWLMRGPGEAAEWDYDLFARRWLNPEIVTMELIGPGSAGPAARLWPSEQEPIVMSFLPLEVLQRAVAERRVVLAGPFFSDDGVPMTMTVASFERGSRTVEWVVSVYDLRQTLRFALQGADSSFGLSLVAEGWTIFVTQPGGASLRETWARAVELEHGDLSLDLYVWPTAAALERLRTPMPQVALIGGILATVVLALGIRLAQVSSQRASDQIVADSLQAEVRARMRAEQSQERRLDELSRSNEEFERFASALSHDLRDPLNAIGLNIQMVLTEMTPEIDPENRKHLERASTAIARLDSMLERLLAYARAGGGTDAFELVDTQDLFDEVIANLEALVEEHGAKVTADNLPFVIANRSAISRLLQNLISNAMKYRSEETPAIRVAASQGEGEWAFSVADNGRGMSEQQIGRAFDLFWRGDSNQPAGDGADDIKGEGIGLAACKRIVESHGGRMWIESTVGAGSTFFFSLPADPASLSAKPDARPTRPSAGKQTGDRQRGVRPQMTRSRED
jgi:signal transduction histidine kinase